MSEKKSVKSYGAGHGGGGRDYFIHFQNNLHLEGLASEY